MRQVHLNRYQGKNWNKQKWQSRSGYQTSMQPQQHNPKYQWRRSNNNNNQHRSGNGKNRIRNNHFSQNCLGGYSSSGGGTPTSTPSNKKVILIKSNTKISISREIKTFSNCMESIKKRPRNIIFSRMIQESTFINTFTSDTHEQGTIMFGKNRNPGNVGNRSHSSSAKCIRPVNKQYIPSGEEGRIYLSISINLCPISTSKWKVCIQKVTC